MESEVCQYGIARTIVIPRRCIRRAIRLNRCFVCPRRQLTKPPRYRRLTFHLRLCACVIFGEVIVVRADVTVSAHNERDDVLIRDVGVRNHAKMCLGQPVYVPGGTKGCIELPGHGIIFVEGVRKDNVGMVGMSWYLDTGVYQGTDITCLVLSFRPVEVLLGARVPNIWSDLHGSDI
eukprot:Pompholyxophrys_punicea_v1_NODE_119_length_3359_cov_12.851998.p2 type:complete len:177 gc:universal NODE_119_length_3359_cov_12.851998:2969-2439(-)